MPGPPGVIGFPKGPKVSRLNIVEWCAVTGGFHRMPQIFNLSIIIIDTDCDFRVELVILVIPECLDLREKRDLRAPMV